MTGIATIPFSALRAVDEINARAATKKAAGRLLDGRTWDEMPNPAQCTEVVC